MTRILLSLTACLPLLAPAAQRPNIITVFIDDIIAVVVPLVSIKGA